MKRPRQTPRFFARKTICCTVRISGGGERTHPAFLLPDGLEQSKEFRFGVHQPLPVCRNCCKYMH